MKIRNRVKKGIAVLLSGVLMFGSGAGNFPGDISLVRAASISGSDVAYYAGEEQPGNETSGENSAAGEVSAAAEATAADDVVSGGNAGAQDEAVKTVQALIDALPENITAENAATIGEQLAAIDEALAALGAEQRAELDMTRYNNICAALTTFVAVQDDVHSHPICGATDCTGHEDDSIHSESVEWIPLSYDESEGLLKDKVKWNKESNEYYLDDAGNYYLANDLILDAPIVANDDVSLCLNGHSITQTGSGEAIRIPSAINSSKSLSLCDCTKDKKGYITAEQNYGVFIGTSAPFNMYGGIIKECGNAGVLGWGTFNMYGGTITKNNCGVIMTQNTRASTFNMYGGEIIDNKGSNIAGGVYVTEDSTFTMYGGEISGNSGASKGGGVYANEGGTFTMLGGKITGNNSSTGGGVYVTNGTFTMSGGESEISGNSADKGGGVYVTNGTFIMSDGKITGNNSLKSSDSNNGNVYVDTGATFKVSGTAKIQDNWLGSDKKNDETGVYVDNGSSVAGNVYLFSDTTISKTITIEGLETGASIGVTYGGTINADTDAIIATGADNGYPTGSITSDNTSYHVWRVGDDVKLTAASLQEHPICGGTCADNKHSNEVWRGISDLTKITSDGNYYLTGDVNLSGASWTCNYDVKLCLNGNTINSRSGYAVIQVASGKSLDITDCNATAGKITHASGDGRGIEVTGSLTLWNGAITGNTSASKGGGVYVNSNGSFTMNGGAVTGNTSEVQGGGVYVNTSGSFTMNGGTVTQNTASDGYAGGGVYVASTGTFIMNNGSITGNTSGGSGGGMYLAGSFQMNGGVITGNNTSSANATICAGGVYVSSTSTFTVSGDVTITDNWKNGAFNSSTGKYEQGDGEAGNVYLAGNGTDSATAIITIEEGLTENARIGVRKSSTYLAAGTAFKIATGATGELEYTKIFSSDVEPQTYFITRNGDELYLGKHQHSWTYALGDDGATITATCSDTATCPKPNGGSKTILKPAHAAYGDGKDAAATWSEDEWAGGAVGDITYTKGGVTLEAAPTDVGTYTASFTVGDVTASVTYTIEKGNPKPEDFEFTPPVDSLIYDGNAKVATVKVKDGIEGMGEITWKYIQGQTGEAVSEPTDADTYTVVVSVAEGANYKAADNVSNDAWMFEIERNSTPPVVELSENKTYTYTGSEINPPVTVTVDGKTLVEKTDYTVSYGYNTDAGEDAGEIYIYSDGNYSFDMYTKKFNIEKAEQSMSFASDSVDKTYSDCGKSVINPLTRTSGDGAVTYSSSNEAVAMVDSNGVATIVGVGTATITATAAATSNYKESKKTYTLTVDKALLKKALIAVDSKNYNGNADADVVVFYFVDENDTQVTLARDKDYTVEGKFASPNASSEEQKVEVKITLTEACAKNYELATDTYEGSAFIYAQRISIASAKAEPRSYEQGNTLVAISGVTFNDVVKALEKDVDYEVTGEMDDAYAGTDKEVRVEVTLLNSNYELDVPTTYTTVDISKAKAEITAASTQQIVKNGVEVDISGWATTNNTDSDAELTYALNDAFEGISLDGNMLTAANDDSTVESFAIKVTAAETANFTSAEKIITVSVVDKLSVGIIMENIPKDFTVTYGDPDFSMTAGFDADGNVPGEGDNGTWKWESSNDSVLEIISGANTTTPTIKVNKAGSAFLIVTYTSDTYFGSGGVSITVNPKSITKDMIADIPAQEYTGNAIQPKPEVKDGTVTLASGTDFDYSYSGNTNAGTATLTVTGKGNYTGTASKNFTISPKSINGATIVLDAKSFAYTGSEQTVSIASVKLDGWSEEITYKTVSGNKATNAGTVTLTVEGTGNYTGTATTTWTITKTDPELADFDVTGLTTETYDGTAKTVAVTAKTGISGMGDVTVKYNGSTEASTNAGSYKVTIDVSDGRNYNAKTLAVGTLTINKAAAPALKDINEGYKYTLTGDKTVKLAGLVADATGYTLGAVTGDTGIISGYSVGADGVLKYTLTGTGEIGNTVTLPVTITSVNYEDAVVKVVITLKAKDDQAALTITCDDTVVYGETLTLGTTGGSGTGKVTYSIDAANSTGEAVIDGNVLTPVKVGTITVVATKASDADYNEAVSAAFVITITKATPTGEPKYTEITTDGKTLADAGLTLTGSTVSPGDGALEWVDDEGNKLSDETEVEVNKTYKWRFTPTDDNYGALTGETTLWHVDAPAISGQPKDVTVRPGEKVVFEVTATGTALTYRWQIDRNDGKGFVDINGADGATYTSGVTDMDCNGFKYRCVISNAAGSVTTAEVTLTVSELYIMNGADSSWTQNTDEDLSIRGNGAFSKFLDVKVDGKVIGTENYTVKEGSTIVTLKSAYLKTLSAGSHSFEIVWTDGSAGTHFTVALNNTSKDNDDEDDSSNDTEQQTDAAVQTPAASPKTGDASNYVLWMVLLAASVTGVAGVLVKKKKE